MPQTAQDIMTREVITVTPSTFLRDFARICTEDNVSGAPVVRVDGTLVGVVSKTDLVSRLLEDDPRLGTGETLEFPEDVRQVDDIMQTDVVAVDPATPVEEVARRMAEERVHRVVVVNGDQVVGIITSLDLLQHFRA